MKSAPWILLAFALVYIIYLSNCNKPAPSVPQSKYDALEKRYNDTLEDYHAFKQSSDSSVDNATSIAIQADEQAKQSQAALDHSRETVSGLLLKLDAAAREKPDSTWVGVSPRYKDGCDSLRIVNLTLNYRITQAEQDNQQHVDALNYETRVHDTALQKEREFNAQFRQQLANCITTGKQQEQNNKPRAQLYAGIALWGNQFTPMGGGEVNVALKTPRDQMYELKGAYIKGWWFGAGTKFKLHF